MKTFFDLSAEEKVALTAEQLQYYAKIDCANRGIIIPQKPISEVKEDEVSAEKIEQENLIEI